MNMYTGNPFTTLIYGTSNAAQAVKMLHPNGGDIAPSMHWIVIMIPSQIGSIPAAIAGP